MEYIKLEVADYEIEVLALHEMPGLRVIKLLATNADMQRLKGSIDLMRLGLRNPLDWETKIKYMTMAEIMKLVDQWMSKSQELSNQNQMEEEQFEEDKRNFDQELQDEKEGLYDVENGYEEYIDKLLSRRQTAEEPEEEDLEEIDPDLEFEDFFNNGEEEDGK